MTPEQIQMALLKAFSDKADAEAKVKAADAEITALRNLLTGYKLALNAVTPPPSTQE